MNNIDFSPTAFTVKDPGNGKDRRYEAVTHPRSVADAAREFSRLAEEYPALVKLVVPDHFIQVYCQTQDNNSWSGGYGVSTDQARMIFLNLLEAAVTHNKHN